MKNQEKFFFNMKKSSIFSLFRLIFCSFPLLSCNKDYPAAQCFVFYGGAAPLHLDGIAILPVEQALRNLGHILDEGGAS